MGQIRNPQPVLLLCAICYKNEQDRKIAEEGLITLYGPIDDKSNIFDFSHTNYYAEEMGKELKKYYVTFQNYIDPSDIVNTKIETNSIEEELSDNNNRRINLDPGYIEVPKLVLATTKNFSHRIYIGNGIYGDVQLFWQGGTFQANPWTYPDYYDKENLQFFVKARNKYFENIQKGE